MHVHVPIMRADPIVRFVLKIFRIVAFTIRAIAQIVLRIVVYLIYLVCVDCIQLTTINF